jgi:prepilin-type N-terminal cleavage/methylation domain-containing protein
MCITTKQTNRENYTQISRPSYTAFNGTAIFLSSPKGYTLIETIITIGLIAILTSIAVFQVNPAIQRYRLTGASRLVWGDFQNAKMTAIKTNSSVTVTFNSTTSYTYTGLSFTRDLSTEYPGITVSNSGATITFSSSGQIPNASGGNITVTISGSAGTKTITLSWTGSVVLN